MNQLLTPDNVAELLQISSKTVYKHKQKLGGFYPAGLRILRFNQEVIHGIMEGQSQEPLVLQVPISGQKLHGERVQGQKRSRNSKGDKKKRSQHTDPNRHDLLGGM